MSRSTRSRTAAAAANTAQANIATGAHPTQASDPVKKKTTSRAKATTVLSNIPSTEAGKDDSQSQSSAVPDTTRRTAPKRAAATASKRTTATEKKPAPSSKPRSGSKKPSDQRMEQEKDVDEAEALAARLREKDDEIAQLLKKLRERDEQQDQEDRAPRPQETTTHAVTTSVDEPTPTSAKADEHHAETPANEDDMYCDGSSSDAARESSELPSVYGGDDDQDEGQGNQMQDDDEAADYGQEETPLPAHVRRHGVQSRYANHPVTPGRVAQLVPAIFNEDVTMSNADHEETPRANMSASAQPYSLGDDFTDSPLHGKGVAVAPSTFETARRTRHGDTETRGNSYQDGAADDHISTDSNAAKRKRGDGTTSHDPLQAESSQHGDLDSHPPKKMSKLEYRNRMAEESSKEENAAGRGREQVSERIQPGANDGGKEVAGQDVVKGGLAKGSSDRAPSVARGSGIKQAEGTKGGRRKATAEDGEKMKIGPLDAHSQSEHGANESRSADTRTKSRSISEVGSSSRSGSSNAATSSNSQSKESKSKTTAKPVIKLDDDDDDDDEDVNILSHDEGGVEREHAISSPIKPVAKGTTHRSTKDNLVKIVENSSLEQSSKGKRKGKQVLDKAKNRTVVKEEPRSDTDVPAERVSTKAKQKKAGALSVNKALPQDVADDRVWKSNFVPLFHSFIGTLPNGLDISDTFLVRTMQLVFDHVYNPLNVSHKIDTNTAIFKVYNARLAEYRNGFGQHAMKEVNALFNTLGLNHEQRVDKASWMLTDNRYLYETVEGDRKSKPYRSPLIIKTLSHYYSLIQTAQGPLPESLEQEIESRIGTNLLDKISSSTDLMKPFGAIAVAAAGVERAFLLWSQDKIDSETGKPKKILNPATNTLSSVTTDFSNLNYGTNVKQHYCWLVCRLKPESFDEIKAKVTPHVKTTRRGVQTIKVEEEDTDAVNLFANADFNEMEDD
ncbi:hypothetical protein EUX98_g7666 [Antrodiella citrinella]|uniref:DUF6532 domain-containing protein n=1 Tax=Antrodiella citrinella TaxID=2447956 RepID=A0A4S4MT54_9APHY|nr:hypothetical protein EUX98_g7666 [Antrodiella citrinella]